MNAINSKEQSVRKIEDIIDIQKAKGNYNVKQVAFNLPSGTNSSVSINFAKSLEFGNSRQEDKNVTNKKLKKIKSKRRKTSISDNVAWPSDSDITVLRMKLNLDNDIKENVNDVMTGDGLHLPDSSSMVNLATLMIQAQSSKQSVNIEEFLLPLNSWEGLEDNKDSLSLGCRDANRGKLGLHLKNEKECRVGAKVLSTSAGKRLDKEKDPANNKKLSKMLKYVKMKLLPLFSFRTQKCSSTSEFE